MKDTKEQKPYSNTLIYGKDPDEGIVAMHMLYGKESAGEWEKMRCYYRVNDRLETVDHDFYPLCLVSEKGYQLIQQRCTKIKWHKFTLEGDSYYKYAIFFNKYKDYKTLTKTIIDIADKKTYEYLKTVGTAEVMFMIQTGKTMLKGMEFNDMHRMAFDIETYTEGFFPNANRDEDQITIITIQDNRGGKWILHTARDGKWNKDLRCHEGEPIDVEHGVFCDSEEILLNRFRDIIIEQDPDVIEGHNIFKFDLPYIVTRMEKYGIQTKLGRDGWSSTKFWNSRFRAADKTYAYHATSIRGRNIIDTYFAAMSEDVFRRDMENYQLKYLAKYYDVVSKDREYVPGADIPKVWREDPMRLLRYALNDVEETMAISEKLLQSTFYLTQMIPMTYEKVARAGQGTKIESLFLREYYERRHSVAKTETGQQKSGGHVELYHRGVFGPILYADVESLYPSIMLNYNIQPESEELGIFQPLLKELTNLRFQWKNKMREYDKDSSPYMMYEGMQNAAKIVINSFYGNLSAPMFIFNDYSEGERVAVTGQKILKGILKDIESDGGVVIECDTDGVMFLPPESVEMGNRESELAYIDSLSKRAPEGINVGHDGTYKRMVSFKSKNYVLLESDDKKPKFKGSALNSRGNERFVNRFIRKAFQFMLDENVSALRDLYLETRQKIIQKKMDISEFSATNTLKKTLNEYKAGVKINGLRHAQYEIALDLAKRGMPIAPGDRINYYVGPHKGEGRVWEMAKWEDDYANDENIEYYLGRLEAAMNKIRPMFRAEDFKVLTEVNTGIFPLEVEDIRIPQVNIRTGQIINRREEDEDQRIETSRQREDAHTRERRFGGLGFVLDGTEDDYAGINRAYINGYIG